MPDNNLQNQRLSDFDQKEIGELLKRAEDEVFDRTLDDHEKMGEKIAGFATKNGGLLLIGQYDLKQGGQIAGLGADFQMHYNNALHSLDPKPALAQKTFEHLGHKVALIRISHVGDLRPCAFKKIFYERKGASNVALSAQEVRNYVLRLGINNTEKQPTFATPEDADPKELKYYTSLKKRSQETVLQSLCSNDHLSRRGAVIIAKNPRQFVEGCFLEIQRYAGSYGSPPVPVGDPIQISKPARLMIEESAVFIMQNLPVQSVYAGAQRQTQSPIPVQVIREAVTNAVAHRNYSSSEHILIRIYDDGFDISNPAVLTQAMWMDIQNTHSRYHPNEGIYDFLNPAKVYEGRGEGIWKIKEEMEKLGCVPPDFKLMGDQPSLFYARVSLAPAKAKEAKMQRLEKLLAAKKSITSTDVMDVLKISRVTAIQLLNLYVQRGLLTHEGHGRSSHYIRKTANLSKE